MSEIDREYLRSDEEIIAKLEHLLNQPPPPIPAHCVPTKQYLAREVLPHLEAAMRATAKERPKNAIQFFSYYLLAQRGK